MVEWRDDARLFEYALNQGQAYEEEMSTIDSSHAHEIDLSDLKRQHSCANKLLANVAADSETGTQHSFSNTCAGLIVLSPRKYDAN